MTNGQGVTRWAWVGEFYGIEKNSHKLIHPEELMRIMRRDFQVESEDLTVGSGVVS